MIIRSVELGHTNATAESDGPMEEDEEEGALMQRSWPRRLGGQMRADASAQQFGMLSQTFLAALEKLSMSRQLAVSQAMKRLLHQRCGLALSPNARAFAVLVVHGDGDPTSGGTCSARTSWWREGTLQPGRARQVAVSPRRKGGNRTGTTQPDRVARGSCWSWRKSGARPA